MWTPVALSLLLAQAPPLRLAPPWLLGQTGAPATKLGDEPSPAPPPWHAPGHGVELGTRLLPYGEAEPSRGPIAPPPPPGPPPLSPEEWRETLLERARLAHHGSDFAFGPKDPWHAVALSAEGLLAGLLLPPLLTVGPSAGQAYAGEWTQAAVTSSFRTVFVIAIAVAAVWFGSEVGKVPAGQLGSDAVILDAVTLVSGLGIAVTSGFDIATAYSEAEHANAMWERRVLGEAR